MSDLNDKELTVWGFTKGMRTGLITFILAVMMGAIGFLYREVVTTKDELYGKMIERLDKQIEQKTDSTLRQPIKAINDVVGKVDTAARKATSSAERVDSLATNYTKKIK